MDFAELFAGVAGFRYGLEQVTKNSRWTSNGDRRDGSCTETQSGNAEQEFRCVWANEWDKYAAAIYRYHFGDIIEADIRTVDARAIPDIDLLTFGWPCQDNSVAGQRAGQVEGSRSGLLTEAVRILRAKRPKYFIAENVPGLFSVDEGRDFYETVDLFTDAGYDVQWQVLNTRWFLPQNRERIYFVGHLRGLGRPKVFPFGEDDGLPGEDGREMLPSLTSTDYKGPSKQRAGLIVPVATVTRNVSITLDETSDVVSSSGGIKQPLVLQKTHGQTVTVKDNETGCLARGSSQGKEADVLPCLDVSNSYAVNFRRLTPRECERLQGFPDDFTKYGRLANGKVIEISDTQRYKVLGNAASTPVVTAVGERLLQAAKL